MDSVVVRVIIIIIHLTIVRFTFHFKIHFLFESSWRRGSWRWFGVTGLLSKQNCFIYLFIAICFSWLGLRSFYSRVPATCLLVSKHPVICFIATWPRYVAFLTFHVLYFCKWIKEFWIEDWWDIPSVWRFSSPWGSLKYCFHDHGGSLQAEVRRRKNWRFVFFSEFEFFSSCSVL